jgi:hypothetical protein
MHLDLHAIRSAVNELERLGISVADCRDAGLSENESLEQIRHVVHQWKTPFRAPYSGGSSFLQLIVLRHDVQKALDKARVHGAPGAATTQPPAAVPGQGTAARAVASAPAAPVANKAQPPLEGLPNKIEKVQVPPATVAAGAPAGSVAEASRSEIVARRVAAPEVPQQKNEDDGYLQRCVADITEQLRAMPAKNSPTVSAIVLGGCKLLVATWEAQAFFGSDDLSKALQRTVAARTILYVCMERHKKNEATDLTFALEIARAQVEEMKAQVEIAKQSKNIDAAVNLAATAKRLLSLIADGEKLVT